MAFSLEQLAPPATRPVIATIVGEGGIGKTSLAAMFPKPVVIRTEDGITPEHDVMAFPVANSSFDVIEQINLLGGGDHDYRTLVIDSITDLNTKIEHEIVAADPKATSIVQACGGFGAGIMAASERHRYIRELCGLLSTAKKMHIVFIAHAETESFDPPDAETYQRYTIRMNKKCVSHYSDNVDLVAFLKLKTFTTGGDKEKNKAAKASSNGTRIVTCYPTANHISKNRYGIESDLVYEKGVNPFVEFIPQIAE